MGIVICNYNKKERVLNCIRSVLESKMQDFDLYVVDNASSDGSAQAVREVFGSRAESIENKENLGGSGGFNTGLRRALQNGYPYLMCLDNDVLVDENAVGELYDFLESHPDVGMAGSKVYHMEEPDLVQNFGITVDFRNYCVEANYLNRLEDGTMPEVVYCDSVPACSLMVRSSVARRIGLLPEENFLYWDDTEWGYRCNLAGFRVASCGKSQILHAMGAKAESRSALPTYYAWRNWFRFFMRYTPQERWEGMAGSLLTSLFDMTYESNYNKDAGRMRTVMCAYDDALHGVVGKAPEGRIFPVSGDADRKLAAFVKGRNRVYIRDESRGRAGDALFEKIRQISPGAERAENPDGALGITACDYIFHLKSFRRGTVYADPCGNLVESEEDEEQVARYPFCKEFFLSAQLPVFLNGIRAVRRTELPFPPSPAAEE